MKRFFIFAMLAIALMSFGIDAQAQDSITVAVATPSHAKTPVSASNMPRSLDKDLANKHADFLEFAKRKISSLNRNHRLSKNRMQILEQPDGSFRARYHRIDTTSLVCTVRRSKSKAIPFVAVLAYKEKIYEATVSHPSKCNSAEFIPIAIIPNRHIFSFKKGHWQ